MLFIALQLLLLHLLRFGGCSSNLTMHSCFCSVSCAADLNGTTPLINSTTPAITPGPVCCLQNVSSAHNSPEKGRLDQQVAKVCFCGNSSAGGSHCQEQSVSPVHLFPGKLYIVHILTANSLGAAIRMPIVAQLNNSWQVGHFEQNFGENCSEVSFSIASNDTNTGGLVRFSVPLYNAVATMSVYLEDCPHGFSLDTKTLTCECSEFVSSTTNVRCESNTGILLVPYLTWLGIMDGTLAYTDRCLLGYCGPVTVSSVTTAIEDVGNGSQLCTGHHAGVACGGCEDGFSIVFGDVACSRCSNWYLATIFFYMIAGVLLVAGVFALDLTVSRGTVIGLVFMVNVSLSTHLFSFSIIPDIYKPLHILISITGLSLGFPLCFYDGMTALQRAVLEFVFPAYIIFIVVVIIIVSKRSPLLSKMVSHSSVKSLATLPFLTYGKLLNSIFWFFQHNTIFLANRGYEVVWLIDGSVRFFQGWHAIACVFAIVILLIFVLPYTVLITFGPFMIRWQFGAKLMPFLDAHSAPYKDRYRYWFGVRLWIIIVVVVLTTAARTYRLPSYLVISVALNLFLGFEALVKPYKNNVLNYLDMALILPFSLTLVILPFFNISDPISQIVIFALVIVLNFITFVAFCAIVIYHINDIFNLVDKIKNFIQRFHRTSTTQTNNNDPTLQAIRVLEHRVYDGSQLREPVLSICVSDQD